MLTEGQLKRRRLGLGGSDVAAILGLNPYATPLNVWADKTGKVPLRSVSPDNEAIIWGNALEPVIADQFAKRTKCKLDEIPEDMSPLVHEDRDWQRGTPDRLIVDRRDGLEIKTAGWRMAHLWGEAGTDYIPAGYHMQCDWYMSLMGYEIFEVAALIGGQDFRMYTIERDPRLEEVMLERAHQFWFHFVKRDIPPEPMRDSDKQTVAALFAAPSPKVYVGPTRAQAQLARQRFAMDAKLKDIQKARDIVDAKLGIEMQMTPGFQFADGKVRWQHTKGKTPHIRFYAAKGT